MKIKHSVLIGFGLIVLYLFFWPSEKDRLDKKMAELCKKDGGVNIYETVKLPPEMFDDLGNVKAGVNIRKGKGYVTQFGGAYELATKTLVLKKGDSLKGEGQLVRHDTKLVRIIDNKVLAEIINYNRAGGDRWFAGMPSQNSCKLPVNDFLDRVFKK